MDISIIIVSWNVKGLLEKCLASLHIHTRDIAFEVIVVDNASSDGTIEMVKHDFPQVRLIANAENLGFAAANNQGIKESSGKYILLLNPDTELTENSLKKVFDKMEENHPPASSAGQALTPSRVMEGGQIGVLGCTLHNSDGTLQPSVRRFPRVRDVIIIFFKLYKIFPGLLDRYLMKDFTHRAPHPARNASRSDAGGPNPLPKGEGMAIEVDQVMGAFFCIRRSVIDTIGPFDDKYFIWFEEVDFCRRAKAAGFKVVYWPGTSIIHHGGQSFSQQMTLKKQWWFFKSALRHLTK